MEARPVIIWSDRYTEHTTGDHPESPRRIAALRSAFEANGIFERSSVLEPSPASAEQVLRAHDEHVVQLVERAAERGGGWLDPDTYVSSASYEIALLAAGGAINAVDAVMAGAPVAFAFSRPPGHHAETRRAMGFCLFNNIAVAALHARAVHGLERIAIVDWDVHHGNGTEEIFWEDPGVLFDSTHQYPFYPGTGALDERGGGAGLGYTFNIPLPAGADDDMYLAVFEDLIAPALRDYQPQLMLVSAGYDAHRDDPLANMQLTTAGFGRLAVIMRDLAGELCPGKLVFVLEGGYNLIALGASAVEVCNVFLDDAQQLRDPRSERNSGR